MGIPTRNEDQLAVIWALRTLKWSWRRIARIQLPSSHHTVKASYEKACEENELPESAKLPIFAGSDKRLRIQAVRDVEYYDAETKHNECKGGKRSRPKSDQYD